MSEYLNRISTLNNTLNTTLATEQEEKEVEKQVNLDQIIQDSNSGGRLSSTESPNKSLIEDSQSQISLQSDLELSSVASASETSEFNGEIEAKVESAPNQSEEQKEEEATEAE